MALLSPEELVVDLQEILRKRYPRPHPVRQLLLTGRLTKEQLQAWAKNQFHEFRNIHRFFGIRYQKCPVPELRRALLENMVIDVIKRCGMEGHLQDEMRAAVKNRTEIMWLQNESIYQTFVRASLSPDVVGELEG